MASLGRSRGRPRVGRERGLLLGEKRAGVGGGTHKREKSRGRHTKRREGLHTQGFAPILKAFTAIERK